MPPKQASKASTSGKKEASGGSAGAASGKQEELQRDPLQAVILADAFSHRLDPLTSNRPACLLPLCNVPLLDWTLENLALAGVDEIFILASRFTDQIKKHMAACHAKHSFPKVTIIATPDAQSLGDVMRELDSKQIIRSDFILIHADSVANMDLVSILDAHRTRRKRDKDAIMTICTMPVGKKSRTRNPGNLALFFVQPTTSQLVHYAPVRAAPRLKTTSLSLELFEDDAAGAEIDVRNDLVDCGIDICSADVPPLFSENFDYQTLRSDFVLGILTSDLLDSKIFVHVAPTGLSSSSVQVASSSFPQVVGTATYGRGYAARVRSPADYDAISRDVLNRWTHPLGPAGYLPGGQRYSSRSGLKFLGKNLVLSRSCLLGPSTLIGDNAVAGDKAFIKQSVIGCNVKIGARSTINASYIWTDTQVGADCVIERSIIGENVSIGDGVRIGKGSVIADGCAIGSNIELPPFSRVGKQKYRSAYDSDSDEDTDDEGARASSGTKDVSSAELGLGATGFLWPALGEKSIKVQYGSDSDSEDEELDVDEIERSHNLRLMRLGTNLDDLEVSDTLSDISSLDDASSSTGEDDSDLETDNSLSEADSDGGLGESMMLSIGDGETNVEKQAAVRRLREFRAEATASLERAFEENHTVDDASIELKTLRMASNVPLKEVRKTVVAFILNKCEPDRPKDMLGVLDKWCPLISVVASDDQIEALTIVQNFCATHEQYYKIFIPLLKKFYNDDIISEENIVAWWRSPTSRSTSDETGGEKNLALRKAAEEVIRYILESQQSSDEDDDE